MLRKAFLWGLGIGGWLGRRGGVPLGQPPRVQPHSWAPRPCGKFHIDQKLLPKHPQSQEDKGMA